MVLTLSWILCVCVFACSNLIVTYETDKMRLLFLSKFVIYLN